MDLTIESLRAGDEERRHALMRQAFGGTAAFDATAPHLDHDKVVSAYLGDHLVGTVVILDFAMTWGGRAVPCGGVSGVAVSPEARGLGAARRMLAEAHDRIRDRGQVISALYPTTASLYRSVGFEIVGWYRERRIPIDAIDRSGDDSLVWRRVAHDDELLAGLHDDMAARHDGWFRADPQWWAAGVHRRTVDASVNRFSYVGTRAGADVAGLTYRYESSGTFYDLRTEMLAGVDGAAIGAALGLLAGHGTTAGAVITTLPAGLLAAHVPQLQRTTAASDWPWMLRLLDAAGAIEARGWPRAVSGSVDLDVVDHAQPGNAGPHVLEVGDGAAALLRGGSGRVTVSIQDLAMLYAGCDVAAMRTAGLLVEATGDDLDLLAAAFVSRPTIPLFF